MTTPITGPFSKSEYLLGAPTSLGFKPRHYEASRTWYRQRRPYNLPLSFTYQAAFVTGFRAGPLSGSSYVQTSSDGEAFPGGGPSDFPSAYNRAYAKFKSVAVADSASLGIALAQRKQALDMISKRALQLADFALKLKRGQFLAAANVLGLKTPPRREGFKLKRGAKNFGNNFLEYHFGWSPLIGDIGSAVEVLQGGVPPARCVGKATEKIPIKYVGPNVDPSIKLPGRVIFGTKTGTHIISADVFVDNPNLNLATRLGFVNPALIAWDAIPFSFIAGWFVNVDDFLSSFTDFWGMTLVNPSRTFFYKKNQNETFWRTQDVTVGGKTVRQRILNYSWDLTKVKCVRYPGSIPGPSLRFKDPWILSPTRGLTAVSLLLQRLR